MMRFANHVPASFDLSKAIYLPLKGCRDGFFCDYVTTLFILTFDHGKIILHY